MSHTIKSKQAEDNVRNEYIGKINAIGLNITETGYIFLLCSLKMNSTDKTNLTVLNIIGIDVIKQTVQFEVTNNKTEEINYTNFTLKEIVQLYLEIKKLQ